MSNVPPLFKNFGKSFNDLLEKKFDFDRDVKVKTVASGLTFETTARASTKSLANDFLGLFKGTYKRPDVGTFEANLSTDGKGKFSVEADKVKPGLVVKLTGELDQTVNFDVGFSREHFAGSAGLTLKQNDIFLDESISLAYEGLSIGSALKYNLNTATIKDIDFGTQFTQPDFTVALKAQENQQKITASYIHTVNPDVVVGGAFTFNFNPKSPSNVMSLVSSYSLDRDTSAKFKLSSNGFLTGAWEQRVFNPKLKFNAAAEYALKNQSAVPEKFGFGFTFGDN